MAKRVRDTSSDYTTSKSSRAPERWSVKNWVSFLNERAPPVAYILLSFFPAVSGLKLAEGFVDFEKLGWGTTGLLLLFVILRIMDDVKDYETDKICHPDRPIPRGSMSYDEVCKVISVLPLLLLTFTGALAWRYNYTIAVVYFICAFYLYMMYLEFGIGEVLSKSPLIYAITHELILYFLTMFVLTLGGRPWNDLLVLEMGSIVLSAFFTYEVCRKLDPTHLKIKGTYLVIYGRVYTFIIALVLATIGAYNSYLLKCHMFTWPVEGILIISLLALFLYMPSKYPLNTKPKAHKPVEAVAVLYLLVHFIAPFAATFL
ncbi:uncharacterized protein [Dysidea avara]|uniref:uncharacterized protein isoform X2 n=1 Tax=Dysidea avara TaxID=196820 RepID=UPI00332ED522